MTTDTTVTDRATRFRQLHETGVLVLPNAWDAASARLIEDAGAVGHRHHQRRRPVEPGTRRRRSPPPRACGRCRPANRGRGERAGHRRHRDGLRRDPAELRSTIEAIIGAGAVGINIEDAAAPLRDTGEQTGRIRTVHEAADATGVPLFVNARIDTYLRQVGDPAGRLDETVSRARAYIDAGADGIFVRGLLDAPRRCASWRACSRSR